MTRVLAFGDLHLGAGAAYAEDRLSDQEAVLDQIVDVARDRDVDLCLFAGDAFHFWRPGPEALHIFARFARRFAEVCPTVAVLGNQPHDQGGAGLPAALELFEARSFRVSRHPEVITEFAGVNVCTLPSVPVARLVASANGGDRGAVFEQAARLLERAALELRESVTHDGPTVLVGHWSVSGASLPNGLPVADLREPVLELGALERCGYDAVALGHIHAKQMLAAALPISYDPVLYCGSPMPLNFGEPGEHGCWVLDFAHGDDSAEFVPLESRPFVTVDCDLVEQNAAYPESDWTDWIVAHVAEKLPLTNAVVRIRYRATEAQHRRVDQAALKRFCMDAGAHRVYQITPEIVREDRARVAGVDETLEPLALVGAWCEAHEIVAERLRGLAADYLKELVGA